MENAKIENLKWDIMGDFQTLRTLNVFEKCLKITSFFFQGCVHPMSLHIQERLLVLASVALGLSIFHVSQASFMTL